MVEQAETTDQDRRVVLVVDDSRVNRTLLRSTLELSGYDVVLAKSANAAWERIREAPPDLILCDVHMPERDGFDFLRWVKADPDKGKIPFVFLSSTYWGERDARMGLSMGADKFIHRPVQPQELLCEIAECLPEGGSAACSPVTRVERTDHGQDPGC